LIPEYLRLGTWDLLKSWAGVTDEYIEARLALQLVNEAALCVNGIRQKRTLSQKGFELANGLPFVATDPGIHFLLDSHTVAQAQRLQIALGKIRSTFGHYKGQLLAIDGHPIESYSKRQMVRRRIHKDRKASKVAQPIFCLDADTEHYTAELYEWVRQNSPFDLMTPVSSSKSLKQVFAAADQFEAHWAGYATTKRAFRFKNADTEPFCQFIQRKGECKEDYNFRAFLCTSDRDRLVALSESYPDRWHIEEFFKLDQALGWHRAGTMNINIRYGKMTMSLLAQAALHMLRQRIGVPVASWDSQHFADSLLRGLEGDIRVKNDTIRVTYYNAPNIDLLKKHYENLPQILANEGVSANIPWLYDFKLDFCFK
jgi:hypothetical protein